MKKSIFLFPFLLGTAAMQAQYMHQGTALDKVLSPSGPTCSPDGQFLYVAIDNARIHGYRINSATGALEKPAAVNVRAQDAIYLFANPDGNFVFASGSRGEDGFITVFRRDAANGQLTQVREYGYRDIMGNANLKHVSLFEDWAAFPGGGTIAAKAIDYKGESRDTWLLLEVNAQTGELSYANHIASEGGVDDVAIHPNGRFIYADRGESPSGQISVYEYNAGNRSLNLVHSIANNIPDMFVRSPLLLSEDGSKLFCNQNIYSGNNAYGMPSPRSSAAEFNVDANTGRLTYQRAHNEHFKGVEAGYGDEYQLFDMRRGVMILTEDMDEPEYQNYISLRYQNGAFTKAHTDKRVQELAYWGHTFTPDGNFFYSCNSGPGNIQYFKLQLEGIYSGGGNTNTNNSGWGNTNTNTNTQPNNNNSGWTNTNTNTNTQPNTTTNTWNSNDHGTVIYSESFGNVPDNWNNNANNNWNNNQQPTINNNNSQPQQKPIANCNSMSSQEFEQLKQSVSAKNFASDKMSAAKNGVQGRCVQSSQAAQLLNLLSFESDKLQLAKDLYLSTSDKENFLNSVLSGFKFSSNKQELEQFVRSH